MIWGKETQNLEQTHFLDDWRRTPLGHWRELIAEPIAPAPTPELQRWAAFCAAMAEWLCWQDGLPFPEWTSQASYRLPKPWFIYKGWKLRAWQLATTPTPFKMCKHLRRGSHARPGLNVNSTDHPSSSLSLAAARSYLSHRLTIGSYF